MSKIAKLIIAGVVLTLTAGGFIVAKVMDVPERQLATGMTIQVQRPFVAWVKVENIDPIIETRHHACDNAALAGKQAWARGYDCEIGNENDGFTLTVTGFMGDHVLMRYDRAFHDHIDSRRCPQGTYFSASRAWVVWRLIEHERIESERKMVAKALGQSPAAPIPQPVAAEAAVKVETPFGPPPPPPEPPPVPPAFEKGMQIRLSPDFKETVRVQNPEGLSENRPIRDGSRTIFRWTVRFGKTCRIFDDAMHSQVTVIGTDGDDVLLQWETPGFPGTYVGKHPGCPEKVMFFRPASWVRKRQADEEAWRAERAKVLKVLGQ